MWTRCRNRTALTCPSVTVRSADRHGDPSGGTILTRRPPKTTDETRSMCARTWSRDRRPNATTAADVLLEPTSVRLVGDVRDRRATNDTAKYRRGRKSSSRGTRSLGVFPRQNVRFQLVCLHSYHLLFPTRDRRARNGKELRFPRKRFFAPIQYTYYVHVRLANRGSITVLWEYCVCLIFQHRIQSRMTKSITFRLFWTFTFKTIGTYFAKHWYNFLMSNLTSCPYLSSLKRLNSPKLITMK